MLSRKEKKLAALLLKVAASEFGNHGCNDMDQEILDGVAFTDQEKLDLAWRFNNWSGSPEDFTNSTKDFDRIGDDSWMSYLAERLLIESEEIR